MRSTAENLHTAYPGTTISVTPSWKPNLTSQRSPPSSASISRQSAGRYGVTAAWGGTGSSQPINWHLNPKNLQEKESTYRQTVAKFRPVR